MGKIGAVLRRGQGGYFHWCPACKHMHKLPDGWAFNGNIEKPTFHPSFKHDGKRIVVVDGNWTGEWVRDAAGNAVDGTCHYLIADGMIQFCADSWHGRSDIVPMPEIPHLISD
jgi:Family of unknown function (DUF6527)